MADKMFENNQVSLVGEIVSDFTFSHEVYGEGFYRQSFPKISWGKMVKIYPNKYLHKTKGEYSCQIKCLKTTRYH